MEVISLLFSLHICRRKFVAQDLMKRLHFGETISKLSKIIKWNYVSSQGAMEKKTKEAMALSNPSHLESDSDCESSNEIMEIMSSPMLSLQIQFLRLVHAVFDKDFLGNCNKISVLSSSEKRILFDHSCDSECLYLNRIDFRGESFFSTFPPQADIGLISFFSKVLLQELNQNATEKPKNFFDISVTNSTNNFNNWISGPVEIFLKGSGRRLQLLFYNYGFLDEVVKFVNKHYYHLISMTAGFIEAKRWDPSLGVPQTCQRVLFPLHAYTDEKQLNRDIYSQFLIRNHLCLMTKKKLNNKPKSKSLLFEAKLKIDMPFQTLYNCVGYLLKGNSQILGHFEHHMSDEDLDKFFTVSLLQILESSFFIKFLYFTLYLQELMEKTIVYDHRGHQDTYLTGLLRDNIMISLGFLENSVFEDDSIPSKVFPNSFTIPNTEKNQSALMLYKKTYSRMSYLNHTWIYFKPAPLVSSAIDLFKDKNYVGRHVKAAQDLLDPETEDETIPKPTSTLDFLYKDCQWSHNKAQKTFQGRPVKKFNFSKVNTSKDKQFQTVTKKNSDNWATGITPPAPVSTQFPRMSKLLYSCRTSAVAALISSLDPHTICYETIFSLSSILSILLSAYTNGDLPFLLSNIQALSDSTWEASKIHAESIEMPDFPLDYGSTEDSNPEQDSETSPVVSETTEEASSSLNIDDLSYPILSVNEPTTSTESSLTTDPATPIEPAKPTEPASPEQPQHSFTLDDDFPLPPSPILLNLSELLYFWQEYHLRRGRDRLTIDLNFRNNFSNQYFLVRQLLSDGDNPLSLNYHWKQSWEKYQTKLSAMYPQQPEEQNKIKNKLLNSYQLSFAVGENLPQPPLSPFIRSTLVNCIFSSSNSQPLKYSEVEQYYRSEMNTRPIFYQDNNTNSIMSYLSVSNPSSSRIRPSNLRFMPPVSSGLEQPALALGTTGSVTVLNFYPD